VSPLNLWKVIKPIPGFVRTSSISLGRTMTVSCARPVAQNAIINAIVPETPVIKREILMRPSPKIGFPLIIRAIRIDFGILVCFFIKYIDLWL
jgi:hypothetical protein